MRRWRLRQVADGTRSLRFGTIKVAYLLPVSTYCRSRAITGVHAQGAQHGRWSPAGYEQYEPMACFSAEAMEHTALLVVFLYLDTAVFSAVGTSCMRRASL